MGSRFIIPFNLFQVLMADGVTMETGQSALRNVEEDLSQEPEPAQILLLITEELNVREKAQRLKNAAHVTVQVNI